MFLFLNDVIISPKKASPRFTALEVKAYRKHHHYPYIVIIYIISSKNCQSQILVYFPWQSKCGKSTHTFFLFANWAVSACSLAFWMSVCLTYQSRLCGCGNHKLMVIGVILWQQICKKRRQRFINRIRSSTTTINLWGGKEKRRKKKKRTNKPHFDRYQSLCRCCSTEQAGTDSTKNLHMENIVLHRCGMLSSTDDSFTDKQNTEVQQGTTRGSYLSFFHFQIWTHHVTISLSQERGGLLFSWFFPFRVGEIWQYQSKVPLSGKEERPAYAHVETHGKEKEQPTQRQTDRELAKRRRRRRRRSGKNTNGEEKGGK